MEWIDSNLEWAVKNNSQLGKPTEMHRNRDLFFKYLHELGFQKAVEKAMSVPLWRRCVSIEMLQLLLRLGTFQLSDIFYNTVGGVIGGLMYCAVMKARKRL